jgi:cell shape-determining protein MreD
MKIVVQVIAIIVLFGIGVGIFSVVRFWELAPSLLWLYCMCITVESGEQSPLWLSIFCGLWYDLYTGHIIGTYTFAFIISVGLAYVTANHIAWIRTRFWGWLPVLIGGLIIFWGWLIIFSGVVGYFGLVNHVVQPASVYARVTGLLLVHIIAWPLVFIYVTLVQRLTRQVELSRKKV